MKRAKFLLGLLKKIRRTCEISNCSSVSLCLGVLCAKFFAENDIREDILEEPDFSREDPALRFTSRTCRMKCPKWEIVILRYSEGSGSSAHAS
jgi:hypothetical protein